MAAAEQTLTYEMTSTCGVTLTQTEQLDGPANPVHKVGLIYASVTGNTKQIAQAIREHLSQLGYQVVDDMELLAADTTIPIVMCFWCWRSTLDPLNAKRLGSLTEHHIIPVGTIGAHPRGAYAEKIKRRVREDISAAGAYPTEVFLCQGKIPYERLCARRAIPEGQPHYVSEEKLMQLLEGQHHPDALDEYNAYMFVEYQLRSF